MTRRMMRPGYIRWCLCLVMLVFGSVVHGAEVKMSEVFSLAKLPVNEILKDSPVKEISKGDYWNRIKNSDKPVMVMFYINEDQQSQNLATLFCFASAGIGELPLLS